VEGGRKNLFLQGGEKESSFLGQGAEEAKSSTKFLVAELRAQQKRATQSTYSFSSSLEGKRKVSGGELIYREVYEGAQALNGGGRMNDKVICA